MVDVLIPSRFDAVSFRDRKWMEEVSRQIAVLVAASPKTYTDLVGTDASTATALTTTETITFASTNGVTATVTDGAGNDTVTISTPQDVRTSASPTFVNATFSGRTSTRVAFYGASGVMSDDADFTFDGSQLALATSGTAGGLLIGTDTQLYRRTTNTAAFASGDYLEIGNTSAFSGLSVGTTISSDVVLYARRNSNAVSTTAPTGVYGEVLFTSSAAASSERPWGLKFSSTQGGAVNYTNALGATGFEGLAISNASLTAEGACGGIVYARNSGSGTLVRATGILINANENTGAGSVTNSRELDIAIGPTITANNQTRIGARFGIAPDPGAFTGTTSRIIQINSDVTGLRSAIHWGTSSTSTANLYLGAANVVQTDGSFNIALAASAAAPALRLNSSNTGLYAPASNQFGASVNGTAFLLATSNEQIGLNGTASSTTAVFNSSVTTTTTTRVNFINATFNYNPAITFSSSFAVLAFTGIGTVSIAGANICDVTARCAVTAANGLSAKTYFAYRGRADVDAASTLSSGTLTLGGYTTQWTTGTAANFTGGQVDIVNYKVPAAPTGYTGSGSTMTYYSLWALEGQFVHNDNGGDYDARFEGDTDANLLFVDASADTVQVGAATTSDSAKFYVSGKISTSGELEINGALNHDGTTAGFFATAPATQQVSGANLTNNVTSGGTDNQVDNWTDLTTYATDAAAIRNAVYQLSRKLKQVNDALRLYGLLT